MQTLLFAGKVRTQLTEREREYVVYLRTAPLSDHLAAFFNGCVGRYVYLSLPELLLKMRVLCTGGTFVYEAFLKKDFCCAISKNLASEVLVPFITSQRGLLFFFRKVSKHEMRAWVHLTNFSHFFFVFCFSVLVDSMKESR